MFKKKPQAIVRIHHERLDDSIEGILVGRYDGHYHLKAAKIVTADDAQDRPLPHDVMIPASKVAFYEVISFAHS